MLRYEVRLGEGNFQKKELVWGEGYVSPDLSYFTGVTDTSYHLEKYDKLVGTNSLVNSNGNVYIESENVIREGYVIVRDKEYDVMSGITYNYLVEGESSGKTYHYVEHNGKFFYHNDGAYNFTNLLNLIKNDGVDKVIEEYTVLASAEDTVVKVDELFWIENGTVTIDGATYIYDKDEGDDGILKYTENGNALDISSITRCSKIDFYPYDSTNDYEEVTKFKLRKGEELEKDFERITFMRYSPFVKYKNHYCPVKISGGTNDYQFVCDMPKMLFGETAVGDGLENTHKPVYFVTGVATASTESNEYSKEEYALLNAANYELHHTKTLDGLVNMDAYVKLDIDGKEIYLPVECDIINANNGNKIGLYLEDEHTPLSINDNVVFSTGVEDEIVASVYSSDDYSGNSNDIYVIYDGRKYAVQNNLCDRVIMGSEGYEQEYEIKYINGKKTGNDCLVNIDGEDVPMKIENTSDGDYSGGTVSRYGNIVVMDDSGSPVASSVTYDIKPYSGVSINGLDCIIRSVETSSDEWTIEYARIGMPQKYTFKVEAILGSSLYVCSPCLSKADFTSDFIDDVSYDICSDVVIRQSSMKLYIKNKIFGECEVTSDLAFRFGGDPISSDNFYDLFSDLVLFIDSGYINVPIMLNADIANNIIQDDIVQRDFFEAEKKKAINPIVDMEKDIYSPKYIDGGDYKGANTTFKPIYEINLNFHFRTRDLSSWKVNDSNDNIEYKDYDNWFITDYAPYKDKLITSGDTFQSTSDLMGLLYFTNNDIYYQKSRVAKSFARLSFYDSTDPQTQSLLATSSVFVDEHKLFKKYIDNSRKNQYDYVRVDAEPSGVMVQNKLSVMSEFGGDYHTYNGNNLPKINEEHRISSRLTIDNKYVTDTSSEGYYLYIFREYAEKLHPKPIYMKIEFNHAGIGKTIPFLIPMKWNAGTNGEQYPERAYKLKNTTTDLPELKEGIPLSYVNAQLYIPLYAVYDFKNKEYAYVFDSRYVEVDKETGILNLNLFEMKIKDESNVTNAASLEDDLKDLISHKQKRAVINIDTKQFDKRYFNENV